MHLADAKLSLGSALLKRAFISKHFRVPWHSILFARRGDPVHGKPCYTLPNGKLANIDFNISHQAGIVALVGSRVKGVDVGVDITCVNERNDWRFIDRDGFAAWVDVYDEVFSEEELWDIKYNVDAVTDLDGTLIPAADLGRGDRCCSRDGSVEVLLRPHGQKRSLSCELIVEAKLRRFYAFYAYKEAYIKLVGEGLMAQWLRDLEFRNVRSPRPGTAYRCSTHGAWGGRVDDVEVWMYGSRVQDVKMDIQAFEEDKLITTAFKSPIGAAPVKLPPFEMVNLQRDILPYASKSGRA
jgi:4'-phosphopantetheinyl transferase